MGDGMVGEEEEEEEEEEEQEEGRNTPLCSSRVCNSSTERTRNGGRMSGVGNSRAQQGTC